MTTPQLALARLLQLEPNSHTCIGHAETQGRKCQRPIALANRQGAAEILFDITRLDPQSPTLDTKLEELASRLLCINRRDRHHAQVAAIKREWLQDIQNYQALEAAGRADIPPTAASLPIEHAHHTTAPSIQFEHTTAIEEVRQEEPTYEADPTSPIPSSFPTQTPHVQHQDSSHPAAHHGRRSTEGDCAICCEDPIVGGDTTRCAARCRRSLHADCIDLCRAPREAEEGRRLVSNSVARNGSTEMVLLLLLCCGGNARVLLALVAWILILVTRVAAVRA